MPQQKSVILATVDCLRSDHCGFMGYRRPTTPFLDDLAAQSFVFPAAIVAGTPTYYSFPAILGSRYPLALGREVVGLAQGETNLASTLKKAGYKTAFFGAANPYLSPHFGYDFGFDNFRDFLDVAAHPDVKNESPTQRPTLRGALNRRLANLSHRIPGIAPIYDELYFRYCQRQNAPGLLSLDALRRFPAAEVILAAAEKWIASIGDHPFFLWLHFMDPHAPYYPTRAALEMVHSNRASGEVTASRARYLNAFWNRSDIASGRLQRYRNDVIAMYDAGIRWVDAQLSSLVGTLRQSKLWENCIFALTADHGEEFLDHQGRYHAPSLAEELIHVPLLLRVPGAKKATVCGNPFSLLHLAPTLLGAAGLPVPTHFQGSDYWPCLRDQTAWSAPAIAESIAGCTNPFHTEQCAAPCMLAVREAKYKLVLNFNSRPDSPSETLFDLESDPGEQHPLPPKPRSPERKRLLEAALNHLQRTHPARHSEAYLRARLRDIKRNLIATGLPQAAPPAIQTLAG